VGLNYYFDWDLKKAQSNKEKHGVSFEEAASVFLDPSAMTIYDPDHSATEERWITMGISKSSRLLVVCHTFREENPGVVTIRIFSSRNSSKKESLEYGERQ